MTLDEWLAKQPKPVYCKSCGRPLSDPTSVSAGVGPVCAEKENEEET